MTVRRLAPGAAVRTTGVLDVAVPGYRPHPMHSNERIFSETNCYVDLWVEVLHALDADPVPATAFVLGAGFDGRQWDFVKFQPEDLRELYGISVAEMNVWRPVLDHVVDNLADGMLSTVEVDGYWLPDTAGTSYRREHTKTTVVPNLVDRAARRMEYFHNSGYHELSGEDFDGAFGLVDPAPALAPYVEQIRFDPDLVRRPAHEGDRDIDLIARHFARRPAGNPVAELGGQVLADVEWLVDEDPEQFHLWSFGTLRQCGASAELAADLSRYLESRGRTGAADAAEAFTAVATGAKTAQFRLARAMRGRAASLDEQLDSMAGHWATAIDRLGLVL
ncbi:DUF1839 family protein [Rhodococcus daqingensis]|uniref:DUF1839 family protein n=1 Tax=Rhodococcus daqingensis TaxID=2479363 RepID=A0ABW2RST1_9NOCA